MEVSEKTKNKLSILLCLCMLLQNVPMMVFAATGSNLCDHHTQHTAECGYAEGCEAAPCSHVHSRDCYTIVECGHDCDETCNDPCTHECTVESGCVTRKLDCHHVHGDCGYTPGTAGAPCGHSHNESCGYVAAAEGTPCAYAETNPECDHSGDCGFVATAEGKPCGHTTCDETCGYVPATEGTPCTHTHSVKVNSADSCYVLFCSHKYGDHDSVCGYVAAVQPHDCSYQCEECAVALAAGETTVPSTDPVCTCETKCSDDGINGECAVCSAEGADLIICTGKEADSVCTCESDDPEWHAPFCSLYVIPENPECFCAEKCTADIFNEWCDVCYADYTSCSGDDLAVTYLPNGYIAISTPEELDRIRNDLSGKYMLTANIDLTDALAVGGSLYDSKGWIAIGYASSPQPFTGILDGNGYTISGVTAKGGLGIAHLIYENRGTIKNLTVSGNFTYGGVFCHNNAGLIQNCHNNAEVKISLYATSQSDRGGLVNNNLAGGIVECCSNRATIQGTVASGGGSGDKGLHLGGIAGRNTGIIRKCYNTGSVTCTGKSYTNSYAAGIVGEGVSGSTIENCYNTGSIRAELTTSGYQSANNVAAGGILATVYYQSSTTIKNCYNAGSISLSGPYHNQYLGSISGFPAKSTFTNCYYLSGTCGYAAYNKTSYSSIDKLTENQMRTQAAFVGFDFTNTWSMGLSGYYYPILKAGCPHTVTNVPATPATCLKDGNIEHWYCSTCGRYFTTSSKTKEITRADTVIPGGHTWSQLQVAAAEAVHTQTELKAPVAAHYYCAVCDTYFGMDKKATTLEALTGDTPQHSYNDWINTDSAKHWKACTCGLKSQEGNHSFDTEVEETRIPPTSDATGSVTMQCVCGATKDEILYHVTITQAENGSVTTDKESCARNETVTLTVTPDKDYKLESLMINGSDVASQVAEGKYTFTMPGQNITVTATFQPAHVHNWIYETMDSDGDGTADTIQETCGAGCDHSKSITLQTPDGAVYDGARKDATVGGEIAGKYEISYNREPVNAGTYTVTLTVGDTELSLVYQIGAITQVKPAGIAGVDETIKGLKDGKITGVDSTMEYRKEGETSYTAISSTELNNLAAGNYYVRYAAKTNYTASEDVAIQISDGRMLHVYLPTEQIGYTLSVKENGSNEVSYGGSIDLTYQLTEGYTQGEQFAVTATEGTITKNSDGTYTISGITADTTLSVTGISDVTAPNAEIAVTTNKWTEFLNSITFDLFFKQTQNVTITVSDAGSGIKSIEYYLSNVSMTLEQVKTVDSWTDYSAPFSIDTENKYIIYAKVADNAGNILYLSSNGMVIDKTQPVITGVSNGRTYYTTQKVTATDTYLDTLTCNGVTFDGIIPGNQTKDYTIAASDKSGNNTVFEITMLPISSLCAELPTEQTVKTKDETAIEAVREKVVSILSNQCDNATAAEKKELSEIIENCDNLLNWIQQAKRVIALIDAMPTASTVSPDDKDAIDKYDAAWAAYTSKELPPASKRMVDEENKAKLDAMLKALTAYDIIHQSAKYYVKGSGKTLTFTANGYYAAYGSYVANAYGKFVDVEVDGKTVDSKNYTIKAGSTVITLKNSYLESLSAGKHTIQVNYIDGSTDGSDTFRVSINNGNPFTGDSNHMILYSCIMMASLMSMTMMVKFIPRKKGRYER